MFKSFPEIIRKQIRSETKKKLGGTISSVAQSPNQILIEKADFNQTVYLQQKLKDYVTMLLGSRVVEGLNVTSYESGLQIFIFGGVAWFGPDTFVQVNGGQFLTLSTYVDDSWVYVYLKNDGTFYATTSIPTVMGTDYMALAQIWVESDATVIELKDIVDLRAWGILGGGDFIRLVTMIGENYYGVGNFSIENKFDISPSSPESMILNITANAKKAVYIEGDRIRVADGTITVPTPASGIKNYWILLEKITSDITYATTYRYSTQDCDLDLEPYQHPIARVIGVLSSTTKIYSYMIDDNVERVSSGFNMIDVDHQEKLLLNQRIDESKTIVNKLRFKYNTFFFDALMNDDNRHTESPGDALYDDIAKKISFAKGKIWRTKRFQALYNISQIFLWIDSSTTELKVEISCDSGQSWTNINQSVGYNVNIISAKQGSSLELRLTATERCDVYNFVFGFKGINEADFEEIQPTAEDLMLLCNLI